MAMSVDRMGSIGVASISIDLLWTGNKYQCEWKDGLPWNLTENVKRYQILIGNRGALPEHEFGDCQ